MVTSLDKAIAALLSGLAFFLAPVIGLPVEELPLTELGVVVTALIVYFVPNKSSE